VAPIDGPAPAKLRPNPRPPQRYFPVSYFYQAYGVGIDSTANIPGLELSERRATRFVLRFESGPEPEWAEQRRNLPGRVVSHQPADETAGDPSFVLTEHILPKQAGGKCYELSYSDGTRFVVDETAERVWGTFQPPMTHEDLATYFLGPVMGFLLRQRHVTCLHASAVELHGNAVLFSGGAGYGKSTTAAALALGGAPVLAEDIVPLELTEGRYWAHPGYPRVCLWPDSVAKLTGNPETLPRLTPTWEKRFLPLDGAPAKFEDERKPVGLIYLFGGRSAEADAPSIEELRPREALLELVQNTYMNWLLDRERRAEEFDELWRVVQQVPVRRIVAHTDGARIGELRERILADAANLMAKGQSVNPGGGAGAS
jgi:hypothetical protein